MYEFQLTNKLNSSVQEVCSMFRLTKVSRVLVKVGSMRRANPELMTFIFAAISRGTPAEGALFSVMIIPATFFCHSCGRTGTSDSTEFMCPHCSSRNVDLISGLELAVDFLEVEC